MKAKSRATVAAAVLFCALSCACSKEKNEVAAVSPSVTAAPPAVAAPPVVASFVDLTAKPFVPHANMCGWAFIVIVRGKADSLGETLGAGDVLAVQGPDPFDVTGDGLAVVATLAPKPCIPKARPTGPIKHVIRGTAAPELAWAGGTMRAHLDLEKDVSPELYVGRLEGTAPVAEHVHETSWEILCAVEGAGTFTLDGKAERLGPRSLVAVPPNTKHSWKPDDGVKLVAIQLYSPPGPEQRFKTLAGVSP